MLKKCLRCRVRYLYPLHSLQEIANHFSQEFGADHDRVAERFEKNRANVLSNVARYIHHRRGGGKILDIGCAGGYFLNRFFKNPGWESWGVEPARQAAARAAANGINTHVGDLRSAGYTPDSFDVITVLDGFYYFPSPRQELQDIRKVLKQDGLLVLELPLGASRIWRTTSKLGTLLSGSAEPLLRSYHNFFYNCVSLSYVLRESGFKVEKIPPLPANQREQSLQNLIWKTYSLTSSAVWHVSKSKLMLGPRFFAAALKLQNHIPREQAPSAEESSQVAAHT